MRALFFQFCGFILIALALHPSNLTYANVPLGPCGDKHYQAMYGCTYSRCLLDSSSAKKQGTHEVVGLNQDNQCIYRIAKDQQEHTCSFSRTEMFDLSKNMKAAFGDMHNVRALGNYRAKIEKNCFVLNQDETISPDGLTTYYKINDDKYPVIRLKEVCLKKNTYEYIRLTTGQYGFSLNVKDIKSFEDQTTIHGKPNYPYEIFLNKTCTRFDKDAFRFSTIHLRPKSIDQLFDKPEYENLEISIQNTNYAKDEDFLKNTNETYKKILSMQDSFSERDFIKIKKLFSGSQTENFYKIPISRERIRNNVKPFILIPKNDYRTKAKNPVLFECNGYPDHKILCGTKWLWGGNVIASIDKLPYEPNNFETMIEAINKYIEASYRRFYKR